MNKSTITINVHTGADRVPEMITWQASDTTAEDFQKAKAVMLSFWDGAEKAALRIDLWTKDMMVDEMGDFYYQMLMGMADSFKRSTNQEGLSNEMKTFAKGFFEKFRELQAAENR
jgi:gliding motility-associated protein GldC